MKEKLKRSNQKLNKAIFKQMK